MFLFQTCANLRKRRLPSIEGGGGGGKEGPQAYRSCRALLGGKAHVLQERLHVLYILSLHLIGCTHLPYCILIIVYAAKLPHQG